MSIISPQPQSVPIATVVKHFLFLNLIAGLLGLGIVSDLPSRLYLTADSAKPVSLVSDSGRGCTFTAKGMQTAHLWLPLDAHLDRITFRKIPSNAQVRPVEVRLWCNLLWERKWNSDAIQTDAQGNLVLSKENASVGLSKVALLGLLGGELAFAVLSILFFFLSKPLRQTGETARSLRISAIISAVSLALLCFGIIPLQTFLANHIEMGLSLGPVLLDLTWRFVLVAVIAAALLLWSTRFAHAFYVILTVAALLYFYLETGVLSFDYPSFTGDMRFFKNFSRMAWDALVLPASFVAILLAYREIPRIIRYLPLAVVVMGLASLCDVRHSDLPTKLESEIVSEFKTKDQVLREVVYSPKRNVLMYVLDNTATPYLIDLFHREPKFAEELTGFVCYTNHLGMFDGTVVGVAGMATGKYYDDANKVQDYMLSVFSRDSFLAPYLASDAAVFVSPGSFAVGVAKGGREAYTERVSAICGSSLHRRMPGQQPWTLAEIIRFRMSPFGFKFVDYVLTASGWPERGGPDQESFAYPILAEAATDDTLGSALCVWHTIGAHPPFDIDRHGVKDGVVREGYNASLEKTWYAWSHLVRLLARLKARGLYDKSMIVITADHGQEVSGDLCGKSLNNGQITSRAWPIMLVKPFGASENFSYSNLATSHVRLHDLMSAACTNDLTQSEIAVLLECEERYYCLPNDGQFENLYVSADRTPTLRIVKSANDILGECIELNHRYSFWGSDHDHVPPIQFRGFGYWSVNHPRCANAGKTLQDLIGSFSFRVQDSASRYRVKLYIRPGAMMRIVDDYTKSEFFVPDGKYDCEVDVTPDKQGRVMLNFYSKGDIWLQELEVQRLDK